MQEKLQACPFCREMFASGEGDECPACGLALTDMARLPPSADALAEQDEYGIPRAPHLETLPWNYAGRGRGALLVLSTLGLLAFFCPWVEMTSPELRSYSGSDLAQRVGWLWGAGVAWFVLLPLIASRRSVDKMQGARVAAAFLAAVPLLSSCIFLLKPPRARYGATLFQWGPGLWGTLGLSLLACVVAVRFGGRTDDIRVSSGHVVAKRHTLH